MKSQFNEDKLYFLDLDEVLAAESKINVSPEIISDIVFAQNCYCMAMLEEKNPFKRAAYFALFSGNSGVQLTLALQWWAQREKKELNWNNIRQIERTIAAIEAKRRLQPWYPFEEFYLGRIGDPFLPLSFRKEFEFRAYGYSKEDWADTQ